MNRLSSANGTKKPFALLSFFNHLCCAFAAQVEVGLGLDTDVGCIFRGGRFFAMVTFQKRFLPGVGLFPHDVKPSLGVVLPVVRTRRRVGG